MKKVIIFGSLGLFLAGCLFSSPLPEDIKQQVQANYRKYEDEIAQLKAERLGLQEQIVILKDNVEQVQQALKATEKSLIDTQTLCQELEERLQKTSLPESTVPSVTPVEAITATQPAVLSLLIETRISAVNLKSNLVILPIGENDQVKIGMKFEVRRGGQVLGEVTVNMVESDWASARIIRHETEFRVGDEIALKVE